MAKKLTPRERKQQRIELKNEKEVEKKARLLKSHIKQLENEKKSRVEYKVNNIKSPRSENNPDSYLEKIPECIYVNKDCEGRWSSWKKTPLERKALINDWEDIILPKMNEIKKENWKSIQNKIVQGKEYHHHQEIYTLIPEAQRRWKHLMLDEYEELFRFRLGGTRRLWGYRVAHKFHVVWWDPNHQIYPTKKK